MTIATEVTPGAISQALLNKLLTREISGSELLQTGELTPPAYPMTFGGYASIEGIADRNGYLYARASWDDLKEDTGAMIKINKTTLQTTWFMGPTRDMVTTSVTPDSAVIMSHWAITLNGDVMCRASTTADTGKLTVLCTYTDAGVRTVHTIPDEILDFHCVGANEAYSYVWESVKDDPNDKTFQTKDIVNCYTLHTDGHVTKQLVIDHDLTPYKGQPYLFTVRAPNLPKDITAEPWFAIGLLSGRDNKDERRQEGWIRLYGGGANIRWSKVGLFATALGAYGTVTPVKFNDLSKRHFINLYNTQDAVNTWRSPNLYFLMWDGNNFYDLRITHDGRIYKMGYVLCVMDDGSMLITYESKSGVYTPDSYGIIGADGVLRNTWLFTAFNTSDRTVGAYPARGEGITYYPTQTPNVFLGSFASYHIQGPGILDLNNGTFKWYGEPDDALQDAEASFLYYPVDDELLMYSMPTQDTTYMIQDGVGAPAERRRILFASNGFVRLRWQGEPLTEAQMKYFNKKKLTVVETKKEVKFETDMNIPIVGSEIELKLNLEAYGIKEIDKKFKLPNGGEVVIDLEPADFDSEVIHIGSVADFLKITPMELWTDKEADKPDGYWNPYATYVLTADLDFGGMTIAPRFVDTPFYGVFDGGGHTISNLFITPTEEYQAGALFSKGTGCRFMSLKMVDVQVNQETYGCCGILSGDVYHLSVFGDGVTGRPVQYKNITIQSCVANIGESNLPIGGCAGALEAKGLTEGSEVNPSDGYYFEEIMVDLSVTSANDAASYSGVGGVVGDVVVREGA